jgi:hypothetical protein
MALHIGRTHGRLNRLGAVTHHNVDLLGTQFPCALKYVHDQRLAGQRVQHLGQRGLHSAALSGGQNDHFQHESICSGG